MQSAYAYSGKTVTIDGEDYDVPEFSVYEEKCKCCCCRVSYFPSINKYFCNQWEVSLLYPSVIIVLTALAYVFGTWSIFTTTKGTTKWVVFAIGTLIYAIWWVAYLQSMCRSAGYLPWFWFVEKRRKYTYEEKMGGIITNKAQANFGNVCARPERSILSTKARRIVLRADHICQWIGNWVGLKNYRFFFAQLVWFVLLFIFFFVVIIFQIIDLVENGWETTVPRVALIVLLIPVSLFFIFFVIVFIRHIRYLVTNNTTVHELKSERTGDYTNPYDLGCWQNCVETLGPAKYCPIWFCPCPLPRTNDGFVWKRNDQAAPQFEAPDPEIPKEIEDEDGAIYSSTSGIKEESSASSFIMNFSSDVASDTGSRIDTPPRHPSEDKPATTPSSHQETEKPPIPPPMFSDFYSSSDDENEPTKTLGILDALVDKTIDGDDDDDFDAYVQGTKVPPLPSIDPVALTIKETDPEAPAKPKKIRTTKKSAKNKGNKRGTKSVDKQNSQISPKKGRKRVHVKKVRVPVLDEGKKTDKYQVRKIKVIEKKRKSPSKSPKSSNMVMTPPPSPPPSNPKKSNNTKLLPSKLNKTTRQKPPK